MKTDEQIKKIVAASIRRHSIDMNAWKYTRLWDEGESSLNAELFLKCEFEEKELPILYSYIDSSNWTMFATRTIQYLQENRYGRIRVSDIKDHKFGNFKGVSNQRVERMTVETKDTAIHELPYETGKASMGPVYALQTLVQIS